MRTFTKLRRHCLLGWILVLLVYPAATYGVLHLASRQIEGFRVELGGSDEWFRRGASSAWSRSYFDSGPYRVRRGERRMTHFLARAALEGAALDLPASIDSGEAELLLRAHRYGQPGIVHVLASGVRLGSLVFEKDSYPWDVYRLKVPAAIARHPLHVEFQGQETEQRVNLPPGTIVALDWVELRPLVSHFRPTSSQWLLALLLPVLVSGSLLFAGSGRPAAAAAGTVTLALVGLAQALAPAPATAAMRHLWILFPFGALAWLVLQYGLDLDHSDARRLAAAFSLVVLAHSTILFFPNHQPPDLRPHLGQVDRVMQLRMEQFWEFSSTTPVPGRNKPITAFDREYVAPYPPWTYFITHGLRQLLDNPRFWMELLALLGAGAILVMTHLLARALSVDPRAPLLASVLMATEIATWHHASRAHTPGVLGQVAFLAAVAYLVRRRGDMRGGRTAAGVAVLSFIACIAYPGALIHWVLFLACFAAVELIERRSVLPSPESRRALAAAAAGGLASLIFYHPFVLAALLDLSTREAILLREAFQPRGRFFLLRNQFRDTVRILRFGYPLWVLLALPALWRVGSRLNGALARRVVVSWAAAYGVHLVLKDPLFFPQAFLFVKEELMFAPLACILGGITLSQLCGWGRKGRVVAALFLLACFIGQARDYLYNADMVAAALSGAE